MAAAVIDKPKTVEPKSLIPDAHVTEVLGDARLARRDSLHSAMVDFRSAFMDFASALFPKKLSEEQSGAFNAKLLQGLELPNGFSVQWTNKYKESFEGRLYIEKDGIGVSYRPFSPAHLYVYSYDDKQRKITDELAYVTCKPGELPELERLNDRGYPRILNRPDRLSLGKQTPPPALEVLTAYVRVAATALKNLGREVTEGPSLVLPRRQD
jgi:hypothetical protein